MTLSAAGIPYSLSLRTPTGELFPSWTVQGHDSQYSPTPLHSGRPDLNGWKQDTVT